jgi:hypothetical protein
MNEYLNAIRQFCELQASDVVQVILQYHHDQSVSNMFIRLQPKTDFLNGLPFPEWTLIP